MSSSRAIAEPESLDSLRPASGEIHELFGERLRGKGVPNGMSVDVEEYFQVSAFDTIIGREDWGTMSSRLALAIDKILALYDEYDVKATFFTLGWIADRHPEVIKRIAREGHEIASHGHEHTRVHVLGKNKFRTDIETTREKLEDLSGSPVIGYRAPSFSIGPNTPWAHDELAAAGYRYSSSVFPIRHDHYGQPNAPRFAYRPTSSGVVEIPMSTLRRMGRTWPCSGGGYFRLMPLQYSKWAVSQINSKEQLPAVFYFHPWELDPDQPRPDGLPRKTRFRHYLNLDKFEFRLAAMLQEFAWCRMDEIYEACVQ